MTEWLEIPPIDQALRSAVLEIDAHKSQDGWDRPAQLFALVETARLIEREPALAQMMGLDDSSPGLTAIEQDELPQTALEDTLLQIEWPEDVFGCAAVVERFVLPPSAEEQMPATDAEAREYAAQHPDREEVRIVAAATRAGTTYCTLRMRSHDEDDSVLEAPDLVPTLLELLLSTLHNQDDRQAQ